MKIFSIDLLAGAEYWLPAGSFLQYMAGTDPVDIEFMTADGSLLIPAANARPGYKADFRSITAPGVKAFGKVRLTSATDQSVEFGLSDAVGDYNRFFGSVDVVSLPGASAWRCGSASVTDAGVEVVAADADNIEYFLYNDGPDTAYLGNVLVAPYLIVDVGGAKTLASATGLANDATVYTQEVLLNGNLTDLSVTGSEAQTYADLLEVIRSHDGFSGASPVGSVAVAAGNLYLLITEAGGPETSISVGSGNLFSSLTDYVDTGDSQNNFYETLLAIGHPLDPGDRLIVDRSAAAVLYGVTNTGETAELRVMRGIT